MSFPAFSRCYYCLYVCSVVLTLVRIAGSISKWKCRVESCYMHTNAHMVMLTSKSPTIACTSHIELALFYFSSPYAP
eukprot:m.34716 g.34716  ORF g.34716 m.34716 type:complete len:77 (+) comp9800_c0_seq1:1177-1407(+)